MSPMIKAASLEDLKRALYKIAVDAVMKEVVDLTNDDKVSLAFAAGCEMTFEMTAEQGIINIRSVKKLGFRKLNGKIMVVVHSG